MATSSSFMLTSAVIFQSVSTFHASEACHLPLSQTSGLPTNWISELVNFLGFLTSGEHSKSWCLSSELIVKGKRALLMIHYYSQEFLLMLIF